MIYTIVNTIPKPYNHNDDKCFGPPGYAGSVDNKYPGVCNSLALLPGGGQPWRGSFGVSGGKQIYMPGLSGD